MRRLPADAGQNDGDVTPAGLALDRVNDAGEEGIRYTGHRNADRSVAPGPEGDREHVGYVLQLVDRPLDPFTHVGGDIAVVVDHPRDRLGAHPRTVSNVAHR